LRPQTVNHRYGTITVWARGGEVRPDRLVHLGELPLVGYAQLDDHWPQAAHQVGQA
jgi:hypothetical protein